jgi:dUTP pyrophosphatase
MIINKKEIVIFDDVLAREKYKVSKDIDMTPIRSKQYDACFDLKSSISGIIKPGERMIINTGLRVKIPEGFEGQIRPRSGLSAKNGLTLLNSPGTIDSGYRGEILIIAYNSSSIPFVFGVGDRIAQMKISKVWDIIFTLGNIDESDSERSVNGLGSTGK